MKFALMDDYQRAAADMADWSQLPDGVEYEIFTDRVDDLDGLVARLEPFELVQALRERTQFTRELLERLPNLQMIVNAGVPRAPGVDLAAATDLGILVSGARGAGPGDGPAQLTWALILGLARNIVGESRSVREGGWGDAVGTLLSNKTLGIIGLGTIGSRVATIGSAMGMRVIAWSPNMTPERAAEYGAEAVSREAVFADADVVSLHLRLSDRSRGIITADDFARMKSTAFFINVSRGALLDEEALVDALANRRIAGAGFDVYWQEPLPSDHPLRTLPNVLAMPHIGYVTDTSYRNFYGGAVECVNAFVAGEPVNVLNPDVLEAANLRAVHLRR